MAYIKVLAMFTHVYSVAQLGHFADLKAMALWLCAIFVCLYKIEYFAAYITKLCGPVTITEY